MRCPAGAYAMHRDRLRIAGRRPMAARPRPPPRRLRERNSRRARIAIPRGDGFASVIQGIQRVMNVRTTSCYRLALATAFVAAATARAQSRLSQADQDDIQGLVTAYARALGECRAEDFADLFEPGTGYFASGFRGHMEGRRQLVGLVRSERHCLAPPDASQPARPGGASGPTVEIEVDADAVLGIAKLGTAEYQDEYVKTAQGWRFASRTVILDAEKAAGIDARGLLAIHRLGGPGLGDHYVPDDNGNPRLLNSGVAVSVSGSEVMGRAYLKDGGYRDEIYEQLASGEWRVESSTYVPPGAD